MSLVESWLLFMQLGLSYSMCVQGSLIFIYAGEPPTTTIEELNREEVQCTKEQAVKDFYDRLTSHHVPPYPVAVVSRLCPEATRTLAAVSKHYCLPVISYSSSLEFPNKQDLFPHLFSVVPSDYYFAVATVHFINYYNWSRTVLITKDQEHNKNIKEEILSLSKRNNISVIGDLIFPTLASRLNSMHIFLPDVRIFILNTDSNEAKFIFCLAMRQNIGQYSYVWIIPGWYSDRWWEAGGDVVLGDHRCSSTELAMFIVHQRVIAISHYPNILNMTLSQDGVCIQNNSARMLLNDAQQIVMQGLQHIYMEGSVGNYSSCINRMELSLCSPEADDCFNRTLTSIRNASTQSDSGAIEFDEAGSRIPGVVNVFQYRAVDKCKVHVAVINVTSSPMTLEFIGGEDTLWVDGVPSDGTPQTREDFIPIWLTVTANIWSALVIITSVAFIIFMFVFRKRKLVRLTSPSLNYVIAVGIIMFNIGGMMFIQYRIPLIVLHIFCSIRVWLVSIGISLSFATIDVKMWRIFYIFHYPNPSKRKKVFQDWHLFLVVMACVVVDVVILTIASSVSSARLKPVETRDVRHRSTEVDEEGISLNYTVYLCASRWRLIWLGMLFGYKAIIQTMGLIVALRMRNIKIDILNDSKEIALTIYFTSTILVVVIIASVVWEENLTIYSATYAYGIAISTTAILITVFFTKVYKLYKDPYGEKIFTHEHGISANALSGAGGSSVVTNTFPLASDEDRAQALERKLRRVEIELRKYKSSEAAVVENKSNEKRVHSSTDIVDNTNADNFEHCVDHLHP